MEYVKGFTVRNSETPYSASAQGSTRAQVTAPHCTSVTSSALDTHHQLPPCIWNLWSGMNHARHRIYRSHLTAAGFCKLLRVPSEQSQGSTKIWRWIGANLQLAAGQARYVETRMNWREVHATSRV